MFIRTLVVGLVTGLLLGLALSGLGWLTGYPFDLILLDLSYIPLAADYNVGWVQWAAHLVVALGVALFYRYAVLRLFGGGAWLGAVYGILSSLIYYVITPYVAPELTADLYSFALWAACHAGYGLLLDRGVKAG